MLKKTRQRNIKRKRSAQYTKARQLKKRKIVKFVSKERITACKTYGTGNGDVDPSESLTELWEKCINYYSLNVPVPLCEIDKLEESTRHQHECEDWHLEQRKRLTASNFGIITKRRDKTDPSNLIVRLLYPSKFLNTVI